MNTQDVELGLEKLRQEWEPKGFKCELYKTEPGEFWSNPGHKTDEYIILIEGEVQVSLRDTVYRPAVGELFKTPAHTPHKFGNPGETVNYVYWIYAFNWKWNKDGSGDEEGKVFAATYK
jgi:quercetin dioxygenase-like cupin family protein